MADRGRHWLSFSNSDQKVLSDQTRGELWDALVVPGTLATYYKQGVGGYVLARRKPFAIDPRTPLIQPHDDPRPEPRASHETLAGIHNEIIGRIWAELEEIPVEAWTDEIWAETVKNVLAFQTSFEDEAAEKIDKYNLMLADAGMTIELDEPIQGPEKLLPPYWAIRNVQERWWDLSRRSIELALEEHEADRVMPVICVASGVSPDLFQALIAQLPDRVEDVFCWRGSWDEAEAPVTEIDSWLNLIDAAAMRDLRIHNMYGGALSVLMTGLGLAGVNHGVGYSEYRDEKRLSQTGAPPMRYYVPRLRQFYPVPTAQRLVEQLGEDWACECAICAGRPSVVGLRTEQLKVHFLLCREREFEAAAEDLKAEVARLDDDAQILLDEYAAEEPANDRRPLGSRGRALARWVEALKRRLPD